MANSDSEFSDDEGPNSSTLHDQLDIVSLCEPITETNNPIVQSKAAVLPPIENQVVAIKRILPAAIPSPLVSPIENRVVAINPYSRQVVPCPRLPMYKLIPTAFNWTITEKLLRESGVLSGGPEAKTDGSQLTQTGQGAASPVTQPRVTQTGQGAANPVTQSIQSGEGAGTTETQKRKRESGEEGGGPQSKQRKKESEEEGGQSGGHRAEEGSTQNQWQYSATEEIDGQLFLVNYEEVTTTTIKKKQCRLIKK